MEEVKKFEISMTISNSENKYMQIEILEMFTEWAESKDLEVCGSIKPME